MIDNDRPCKESANGHLTPSDGSGSRSGPHTPSDLDSSHAGSQSQSTLDEDHVDACVDPIAVVGFSLKSSCEDTSPDAFWDLLVQGRNTATKVPADRFNVDAHFHLDGTRNNAPPVREGHFIKDGLGGFDAKFFNITPQEASCMDPQQRLLLETVYRAIENAGLTLAQCSGSQTSVYTGSFTNDYVHVLAEDPENKAAYAATGLSGSMLANRVSWFYDFRGTSVNMETACSSSLTALHIACQDLSSGNSSMAVVGGCNLFFHPHSTQSLSSMHFLSPDGVSHSFDDRANGYGRGEGVGVVLLKKLSAAVKDGDTVRAVIRATGANQDGKTPTITQPSLEAQKALIRQVYSQARLSPRACRYFEAHGTGTAIGDPTEAEAIGTCFRDYRTPEQPLFIGAVKANIGHLEGASGVAALIKTCVVLEKGIIPPIANLERINPRIDCDHLRLNFPREPVVWPTSGLRRITINSFGFGGSNAVVIVDDAYHCLEQMGLEGFHRTAPLPSLESLRPSSRRELARRIPQDPPSPRRDGNLFVLSAADEHSLKATIEDLSKYLGGKTTSFNHTDTQRLCYTLNARRSHLKWRAFSTASSIQELSSPGKWSQPIQSQVKRRLSFVFTGQGAQYQGMGLGLLGFRAFDRSLRRSEELLRDLGSTWALYDVLHSGKGDSRIDQPRYSQPLCTALQIALVDLLDSFGISPTAVAGHSSGEIAAAYVCGALSHEAALRVAFHRGQLSSRLSEQSLAAESMMAVGLGPKDVLPYILQQRNRVEGGHVDIGCYNSPQNVTLTGTQAHMEDLERRFKEKGIFARRLAVSVAYHSCSMQSIADEYRQALGILAKGSTRGQVRMISSVTSRDILHEELTNPNYWVANLVSPVRFSDAFTVLLQDPSRDLSKSLSVADARDVLEIGPHEALRRSISETGATVDATFVYHPTLNRSAIDAEHILHTVGQLHSSGHSVDLACANNIFSPQEQLVDLPQYPFNRSQSFWLEGRMSKAYRFRRNGFNELLGTPVKDWNPLQPRWRNVLRPESSPWLKDHVINGQVLYPAGGMLVMAIEGARQICSTASEISAIEVIDARFMRPLIIRPEGTDTQVSLYSTSRSKTKGSQSFDFSIHLVDGESWVHVCQASVKVIFEGPHNEVDAGRESRIAQAEALARIKAAEYHCVSRWDRTKFYQYNRESGYGYGPSFQVVQDFFPERPGYSLATIQGSLAWEASEIAAPLIHPTVLDGFLQLIHPGLVSSGGSPLPTMIPTKVAKLHISARNADTAQLSYMALMETSLMAALKGHEKPTSSLVATTDMSTICLTMEGIVIHGISDGKSSSEASSATSNLCYGPLWKPDLNMLSNTQTLEYCGGSVSPEGVANPFTNVSELGMLCLASCIVDTISKKHLEIPERLTGYVEFLKQYIVDRAISHSQDLARMKHDQFYRDSIINDFEKGGGENKALVHYARNVLETSAGQLEALDSGSQSDSSSLVEEPSSFPALTKYLDCLAHQTPGMIVLEVGAGIGARSSFILSTLVSLQQDGSRYPRWSQYRCTDTTSAYFGHIKEKLSSMQDHIDFGTLNFAEDIISQGFEEESFDLIVASGASIAGQDIACRLKRLQRVLKPGGRLLVIGSSKSEINREHFLCGSLDNRNSLSPYDAEWDTAFGENGFDGSPVAFRSQEIPHWSALVSRKPSTTEIDANGHEDELVFIIRDSMNELQVKVSELLSSFLSSSGQQTKVVSLDEAASLMSLKHTRIVSLIDVGLQSLIGSLSPDKFSNFQKLATEASCLIWVSKDAEQGPCRPQFDAFTGLSRVLRSERSDMRLSTIRLANGSAVDTNTIENIASVLKRTAQCAIGDLEPEYEERDGMFCVNRFVPSKTFDEVLSKDGPNRLVSMELGELPPLAVQVATPGLLDSIHLAEDERLRWDLDSNEVIVKVGAIGVNFRDCLIAMGKLSELDLGTDCAGTIEAARPASGYSKGDRVVVCQTSTFKTHVRCRTDFVAKIPDSMSLRKAASLPTAYLTAFHALHTIARVRSGDRVLVHSGAGGTGQAAIQIAQSAGADVIATVGSADKAYFLEKTYGIPMDKILSSRDASFAQGVKRITEGRGVDVVINSLSGDLLLASFECVAPFGRFIEIGKSDIQANNALPMSKFARNVSFAAVDLLGIIKERPRMLGELLRSVLAQVEAGKILGPTDMALFGFNEVEQALRHIQGGTSMGKIVIELDARTRVQAHLTARPGQIFDSQASYVIVGGLSGIGASIARWMVSHGAKNLILLSRAGSYPGSLSTTFVQELRARGAKVYAPKCDITNETALAHVVDDCARGMRAMPPIKGCIQGAMVLRDGLFQSMTYDDFTLAANPKTVGSWNLHNALPKDLDFFIMLSSVTGVFGNASQANYAAGNTFQDGLAHYRRALGLRATALDLGLVTDQGAVARDVGLRRAMDRRGFFRPMSTPDVLALLEACCASQHNDTLLATQCVTGIESPAVMRRRGIDLPEWMRRPTFRHLHLLDGAGARSGGGSSSAEAGGETVEESLRALIADVERADEALVRVVGAAQVRVARIVGAGGAADVASDAPLYACGLDSLGAVELRNWFENEVGADVQVLDILGQMTLEELCGQAVEESCWR